MKIVFFLIVFLISFHLHSALPTKQKSTKMRQKQENTLPIPIPLYDVSGEQPEESDEEESSGATLEEEVLSDEDDGDDEGDYMGSTFSIDVNWMIQVDL